MFRRRSFVGIIALSACFASPVSSAASEQTRLSDLLHLVRLLEAPRGYNDYYRGVAEHPPQSLTEMSIAEVLAWQEAVDRRSPSEAAGGYMIMEDTLRDLHVAAGIPESAIFDQATQDRLGEHLARDAGWSSFARGEITPSQFGDQLAAVWAALPVLSGPARGRSRYHGIAGNRALIGADKFEHILRNLGSIDIVSEVGRSPSGTSRPHKPEPNLATSEGFAPSRVVRWTSDPFYQE